MSLNRDGAVQRAGEKSVAFGHALELAERRFIPLKDGAGLEHGLQRVHNHLLALVHAEGRDLHDQNIGIFVNDQSTEKIAFGIDDAKGGGARKMPLPDGQGLAEPALEKAGVDGDAFRIEDARLDF